MEPNYKEMYYTLMDATEKMIEILIKAQNDCEEIYIREDPADTEKRKKQSRGYHPPEI